MEPIGRGRDGEPLRPSTDLMRRRVRVAADVIPGMHAPSYEMDQEGLIVERAPAEFRELLAAAVLEDTEEEIASKLEAAVTRSRTRGATLNKGRRHAVRDLADVLEALRGDMKSVMLSKDERRALSHRKRLCYSAPKSQAVR
jgi:hypothetical protein